MRIYNNIGMAEELYTRISASLQKPFQTNSIEMYK